MRAIRSHGDGSGYAESEITRVGPNGGSSGDARITLHVDVDDRRQPFLGAGAALTDASARTLLALPESRRRLLLRELFAEPGEPGARLGLSMLRLTIGASDFAARDFGIGSGPCGPGGRQRADFSVDEQAVLPLLREIVSIRPNVRLIASPWSAPSAMKQVPSTAGMTVLPALLWRSPMTRWLAERLERLLERTPVADALAAAQPGWARNGIDVQRIDDYAELLASYARGLAERGMPLWAMTVQNEPGFAPRYQGMPLGADEQVRLILALAERLPSGAPGKRRPLILAHDHNWADVANALAVVSDPRTALLVQGVAWHAYAGVPQQMMSVTKARPDLSMHVTEITSFVDRRTGHPSRIIDDLHWHVSTLLIGAICAGAQSLLAYNLALDEARGPRASPASPRHLEGVVQIDRQSGDVDRRVCYWAFSHLAPVRPGAVAVGCRADVSGDAVAEQVRHVAFRNADGSVVVVLCNVARQAVLVSVRMGRASGRAVWLAVGDVVTLVLAGPE